MSMKWHVLVLIMSAAAATAQTPSVRVIQPRPELPGRVILPPSRTAAEFTLSAKLQLDAAKAARDAVRDWEAVAPKQFSGLLKSASQLSGPKAVVPLPSGAPEVATACAIPLTTVPLDAGVDKGIYHQLAPGAAAADRMPAFKGLATCRQDRRPAK